MTLVHFLIVAITSAFVFTVMVRRRGLRAARLRAGMIRALECVGFGVAFYVANIALGAFVILGLRFVGGAFFSIYMLHDPFLSLLSLFQGLVFSFWRISHAD